MAKSVDTLGMDISAGTVRSDLGPIRSKEQTANGGAQAYALRVATVTTIDYKNMKVSLRVSTGETSTYSSVPLTFPGAGNRHFLGAMPEPGDLCLVGWGMQESGKTQRPFIVGWMVPGTTLGYDWLPTQPVTPDEFGFSPKMKGQLQGVGGRVRHKLRQMDPGTLLMSSSQGADLVLNESLMLMNRRGNELLLRDQDQALVVRTLQQFHAGAGFRSYLGMVQRDATFLPTQMFADQTLWEAAQQVDAEGKPLSRLALESSPYTQGFLTPASVFQRDENGVPLSNLSFSSEVDPYDFLQRGLFISPEGYALNAPRSNAVYGGKPIYRVSTSGTNSAVDSTALTFVENRIEVAHTSDGTLPVTEQTDGFDADRLPNSSPQDPDPMGGSPNAPFIESVLGTVIGNDPYSESGRAVYGVPLKPVVFAGEVRSPGMMSGMGSAVSEHAATLFKMQPPVTPGLAPTFWSVAKDGRVFASVGGPGGTWSGEVAFQNGLHLGSGANSMGQSLLVDADGSISLRAKQGGLTENVGILLSADKAAVRIFGGASTTVGGIASREAKGSGEGEGALPAVSIESATNMEMRAGQSMMLSAVRVTVGNAQQVSLSASTSLDLQSGDGMSLSSNTYQQNVLGKAEYIYSGPTNKNPTNGALRETKFVGNPSTGFTGGTADKYLLQYGDREETLMTGDHNSTIAVGNRTYNVASGTYAVNAGGSNMRLTPSSASLQGAGSVLVAASGSSTITAGTSMVLKAASVDLTAGSVAFRSPTGLHSVGPQIPGGVLTDGCLDPLTGRPFSTSGTLGVQTIRVY